MKQMGSKKSKHLKRLAVLVASVALLVVISVAVSKKVINDNLKPVGQSQKSQQVTIPLGSSVHQIAVILKQASVIRQTWAFEWYVRNNGLIDKLQAGTYNLRENQSVQQIVQVITNGQVTTDLITILPAQRLDQIKSAFVSAGFSTSDVNAAFNPALYKDHPALVDKPAGASLEGYLYPDSYQKDGSTKPEQIVREALDQMQKYLTPSLRAAIVKQGLTVHQGVILASVVEQEVSNVNDKPKVAQVFLKRYHQGMQLGSDVTAFYGSLMAGKGASLGYDSPYNTRIHTGLPPGPISNVSVSSLDAVAHPAKTNYLYFVAGDDGITYFSKTLQEHQQLTAEHCKKLCSQ